MLNKNPTKAREIFGNEIDQEKELNRLVKR